MAGLRADQECSKVTIKASQADSAFPHSDREKRVVVDVFSRRLTDVARHATMSTQIHKLTLY